VRSSIPLAIFAGLSAAGCALTISPDGGGAAGGEALDIQPAELPVGIEGAEYRQSLSTSPSRNNLDWRVSAGSLAPGLALGRSSGEIEGLPVSSGVFEFSVRASAGGLFPASGERLYSLTIIAKLGLTANIGVARVGQPYEAVPSITGGTPPYSVQVAGLPAGLDYDRSTGRVFGVPVLGSEGLQVEFAVTDSGAPAQFQTVRTTLVIKPRAVSISTESLPAGSAGVGYVATVDVADGTSPYTLAVVAGVLPDGLRLNQATGVISGIPRTAQTETFTIQVTDSDSPPTVAARQYTLEIRP
jgi:hypothetical protein